MNMNLTQFEPKSQPTLYFMGVTTGHSSIMKVFPRWAEVLGHPDWRIKGWDFALHDDPARYREAVRQIKKDPLSLGALVTTHKIDVLEAARDLFDELGHYAQICGEVSCISKQDGRLEGRAKDPISAGLSLDAILGDGPRTGSGYFARTGGHVFCIGMGGAGTAIALHLMNKRDPGDRPERFIAVNRSPGRLDKVKAMVEDVGTDIAFEYIQNVDPRRNDEIMASLPPGSIVINGTGMGKDRPGSPLTDEGQWPRDGIAWELNYRGELDFMHQALAQQAERRLTVEDGWFYFIHGWTQVIMEVFHIDIDPATLEKLSEVAAAVR
jgi:shikimate dehydrogenase